MSALRLTNAASALSIALPAILLVASSIGVLDQLGYFRAPASDAALFEPATVTVAARKFSYRADGEFFKESHVIDAPMITVSESRPLTIMKFQVTNGEYNACIAEGICQPAEEVSAAARDPDMPVTGVSHDDANAYARWLSAKTGSVWSLPTDRQLAFAAGTAFPDDALGIDPDNRNPALRWLADYKREAAEKAARDTAPRISGSFGFNEFGVADFAGNVWEWTTTCHRRVHLDMSGGEAASEPVCGVYVTVGNHRSPMSSFVRDPKGGGCAVGTPPANLGFRLVRDDRWYASLLARLRDTGLSL